MTDQEIHAIVGKTREDYRKAKRELAALQSSADDMAKLASTLEAALRSPERIVFADGSPTVGKGVTLTDNLFEKLTAANVRKLAEDARNAMRTRDALRQRLIELEGEDPEHADT